MKLRIATYNLFEGAAASYNRLVDFVRDSNIDVLCLQEVNGWQEADGQRMRDFTDRGLFVQYAFGNSNTPYKLATFSKVALTKTDAYIEGFWHSVVEARIAPPGGQQLAILNVHLDPWQEASRVRELDRLLRTIDRTIPTILVGDLNSLSRHDGYDPQMLSELQRRGITKFGRSELEYGVTDYLEQAGFVDVAARLGTMRPTVPTASTPGKDREVPVRTDYIFATPDVAAFATGIEVVTTDLTDSISDHYPLIATFDFAMPGEGGATAEQASPDVGQPGGDPAPQPSISTSQAAPAPPVQPPAMQPPPNPSPAPAPGPATVQHDQDGAVFVINHDDEQ